MDFKCFICKNTFTVLDNFIVHLKCNHFLTSTSIYRCGVQHCPQTFSSFRSFIKHMKLKICYNTNAIPQTLNNSANNKTFNNDDVVNDTSVSENISNIHLQNVEQNNMNILDLNNLKNSMLTFSLHYYGKLNFSRKDALELQHDITKIIMCPLAKEIEKLVDNNKTIDNQMKNSLNLIIHFCNNPFEELETEYKFLKFLNNKGYYEKPKVISLDNTIDNVVFHNTNTIAEKKTKAVILPLKFQFRKYFELPGILDNFLQHQNFLKDQIEYTNFINSELWKEKMSRFNNDGSIYIPYFLYFDDFEINNPLGAHSSSILGVYYCFPTAPNFFRSNIKSIFVAALFDSKDVKLMGNDKSFYHLIEDINYLQNVGLSIKLPEKHVQVKFVLGLVVGDNLGVNTVLGFSKSFSSNFFLSILFKQ